MRRMNVHFVSHSESSIKETLGAQFALRLQPRHVVKMLDSIVSYV